MEPKAATTRAPNMSTKPLDRQNVDRANGPSRNQIDAARALARVAHGEEPISLPKGERACLIAATQHPNGVTRQQLTVLTGYKRSSRDAYIQRLKERDYIFVSIDRIKATNQGINALGGDYDPLPTGAALREHVLRTLPEGERKVLEFLIQIYPGYAPRDSIDGATGYKRSSRDAYLQRLSARELIEPGNNPRASETLFD